MELFNQVCEEKFALKFIKYLFFVSYKEEEKKNSYINYKNIVMTVTRIIV